MSAGVVIHSSKAIQASCSVPYHHVSLPMLLCQAVGEIPVPLEFRGTLLYHYTFAAIQDSKWASIAVGK